MDNSVRSSPALLVFAIPLLVIAQIVAGSLHDLTGLGLSIPARSEANETPAVPAVYAFAIWGPIFLWTCLFAIFQAMPAERNSPVLKVVRGPAALAFALNAAWEVNAQLAGLGWPSFFLIVALLAPLLLINERLRKLDRPPRGREVWLAIIPLLLLAGWISVATFASLSTTLDVAGVTESRVLRDVLPILAAACVGAFFTRRARFPGAYAAALGWGLIGILLKNTIIGGDFLVAGSAGVALMIVAGTLAVAYKTNPQGKTASAVREAE